MSLRRATECNAISSFCLCFAFVLLSKVNNNTEAQLGEGRKTLAIRQQVQQHHSPDTSFKCINRAATFESESQPFKWLPSYHIFHTYL